MKIARRRLDIIFRGDRILLGQVPHDPPGARIGREHFRPIRRLHQLRQALRRRSRPIRVMALLIQHRGHHVMRQTLIAQEDVKPVAHEGKDACLHLIGDGDGHLLRRRRESPVADRTPAAHRSTPAPAPAHRGATRTDRQCWMGPDPPRTTPPDCPTGWRFPAPGRGGVVSGRLSPCERGR